MFLRFNIFSHVSSDFKKKKIFYLSTELLNYAFIKFSNEWFEGGKGNGFEENRFINLHPNLQREVSVMADNA